MNCCRPALFGAATTAAAALAVSLACGGVARAQSSANQAERFERQLEQIRRDQLVAINPNIPLDQRVTFDYGAYLTLSYLSADDNVNDNHVLRQTELLPYERLNLDGAHEFLVRARW